MEEKLVASGVLTAPAGGFAGFGMCLRSTIFWPLSTGPILPSTEKKTGAAKAPSHPHRATKKT